MKKKLWISLALLLVIPGLLFTVSCAKKAVKVEPSAAVTEPSEKSAEEKVAEEEAQEVARKAAEEEEAQEVARKVAVEEEKKKKELIEEEKVKAAEEEKVKAAEKAVKEEEAKLEKIATQNQFMYEDIYFEFDKATLLPMALDILKKKAEHLYNNPGITIVIEGHCDERGTNEYNLALGDRRAESAKSFLVDLGILPSRLTTVSYGEERPVDPNHNREAWAKNRRAHFVVE
ncbi:MAG: peptidoglycan-associated lipoprotein Pal [Desulfobacterales bacterium]